MTPRIPSESGTSSDPRGESHAGRLPATEQVLAGYCHDLNGQLASAMGFVYLLGPRIDTEGPGQHLRDCLERIELLLRELRSLVRDEERSSTPSSLADLLRAAPSVLRQHPRFGRAEVQVHGPPDLPAVRVDPASGLRLLLLAIDAAVGGESPPQVDVTVEVQEEHVRLRFGPEGAGPRGPTLPLTTEAEDVGVVVGQQPGGRSPWLDLPRLV